MRNQPVVPLRTLNICATVKTRRGTTAGLNYFQLISVVLTFDRNLSKVPSSGVFSRIHPSTDIPQTVMTSTDIPQTVTTTGVNFVNITCAVGYIII